MRTLNTNFYTVVYHAITVSNERRNPAVQPSSKFTLGVHTAGQSPAVT